MCGLRSPSPVPILFPRPVGSERLSGGPLVVHKYYRPVASAPRADALYSGVVCFPGHLGVAKVSDDELRAALAALTSRVRGFPVRSFRRS